MDKHTLFFQAKIALRKGRYLEARDLLLSLVERDARNEEVWMLLSDLVEDDEDKVIALENVLVLNPDNVSAQKRLAVLDQNKEARFVIKAERAQVQVQIAQSLIIKNRHREALDILLKVVKYYGGNETAWLLLSELQPDATAQFIALQRVLAINPKNRKAKMRLADLKQYRDNPVKLGEIYEARGDADNALAAYRSAAAGADSLLTWKSADYRIQRMENRLAAGGRYIRPAFDVARMTVGPVLFYVLLVLVQDGLNPFNPTFSLWLASFGVLVGSFIVAIASTRHRSRLWKLAFGNQESASDPVARFGLGLLGWIVLSLPALFLLLHGIDRFLRQ